MRKGGFLRSLLAIAVGIGLVAAGFGYVRDIDTMPMVMKVIFVLFGGVLIYAGLYHLWLRIQRRRAYTGGRERQGTARLLKPLDEDDALAFVLFANSHSEWLMSVDRGSIRQIESGLGEGLPARAYLGNDDRIYGLDIGSTKALPISVGTPYGGKLKERVDWAERKKAEWAARKRED